MQFYCEADFHPHGLGFVLLERTTRKKNKNPSVFRFLDAQIPAQPSRGGVETRVLSFIFAHSQHMAVTIHRPFRNMYGRSFMPLKINVSDATAYNNSLKIVASHGRSQKPLIAESPIIIFIF